MTTIKHLIPFLIAGIISIEGAGAQSVPPPSIVAPPEAWVEIQKDSVLLDVRTPEEFEKGNIKGSTLIPYDEIEARVSELGSDKSKTIVVYCASGRRAGKAAAHGDRARVGAEGRQMMQRTEKGDSR